jgi:hypothetical protein
MKRKKMTTQEKAKAIHNHYNSFIDRGLDPEWMKYFSYAPAAKDWKDNGFDDPAEAKQWNDVFCRPIGAIPSIAAEWKTAGFTPEDAIKWQSHFDPEYAKQRRAMGYSPRKVQPQPQRTR